MSLTPSQELAWASHRRHSGATEHDDTAALIKLAEQLGSPAATKKALSELQAERKLIRDERAELEKLRAVVTDERARTVDQINRDLAAHRTAMTKANAELAAVEKRAAQRDAESAADRKRAAELKADIVWRYNRFME
jgi:hypothetical protein